MKHYYVYIITNKYNTVFYTGITGNLIKRIYEHKNKLVNGFTKTYNVSKLVYFEIFEDPKNAINREKAVKNLLRSKKIQLIKNGNSEFKDLYSEILSG
jgi:putative endonuclease